MNKYKLITIQSSCLYKNQALGNPLLKIKATQEYNPEFNTGHYHYVITDRKGNILTVSGSCCGAPTGKIDDKFLNNKLDQFWMEYQLHQKCLKKVV